MKKTIWSLLGITLLASVAYGAWARKTESCSGLSWHEVSVPYWVSLTVQGSYTVEVKVLPDSAGTLRVLGNDAMMADLRAVAEYGVLTISVRPHEDNEDNVRRHVAKRVIAYTAGDFSEASLQGSGDILLPRLRSAKPLTLTLMGSGDIKLTDASLVSLDATLMGSGDIDVVNTSVKGNANFTLMGSGDFDVKKISAATVNAILKGSGDIALAGNAKTVNLTLQGSGDIDAARMKSDEVTAKAKGTGGITIGDAKKINTSGNNVRQSKKIKH